MGKLQVLIDNPERTCLFKFQLEIKEGKTNSATLLKLLTSKESQGSFSRIYFAHLSNVQMHIYAFRYNGDALQTNVLHSALNLTWSGHQSAWLRFPNLPLFTTLLPTGFKRQETASRARYEVPTFGFRRNSIPRL